MSTTTSPHLCQTQKSAPEAIRHSAAPEAGTRPATDNAAQAQNTALVQNTALMALGPRPAAQFVRGAGSWLWDSQDQRYLDLVQGWAVNTLGHAPLAIAQALARQAGTLLQAGPGFHNDQAARLALRLAALSGLDRVFIGSTGAEANEAAVKLARRYGQLHRGGASTIVTFSQSFHGRTLAMMAASGKPGFNRVFSPAVPGFVHCPYNDLAAVHTLLAGPDGAQVAAVMLELVQGEAGVVAAQPDFVQGLRRLCDAQGVLLIFDEVQTGIGRCGSLFAFTQHGVQPDILTLGKGLGGGVPVSAMLAREAVSCFAPGDQGGTYHGNALACAAALAVLDEVTAPHFLPTVQQRGAQLAEGLQALSQRHGLGQVVGSGLLLALLLPRGTSAAALAQAAMAPEHGDGLLVNPAQAQRLRLMPALNISAHEVDSALKLLDQALRRLTQA